MARARHPADQHERGLSPLRGFVESRDRLSAVTVSPHPYHFRLLARRGLCYRLWLRANRDLVHDSPLDCSQIRLVCASTVGRFPMGFLEVALYIGFAWILVMIAKAQRAKCQWDAKTAQRRLIYGVLIVVFVQAAGFVALMSGTRITPFGIIQWVGVYWIALSIFRRNDLKKDIDNSASVSVH